MTAITFVYPYYENPGMFQVQQKNWMEYPLEDQKKLEIIVVDDCSALNPIIPAHVHTETLRCEMRVYRIKKKVPWNWLEARNIGAKKARGDWLLLTDMDHVVTPGVLRALLSILHKLKKDMVYQFYRVVAPDMVTYKYHNDSFLVTKDLFWRAGGYDEDYAGEYGTSGMFRRRLFDTAIDHKMLKGLSLTLYSREVIPDASTTTFLRKEGRDPMAIPTITKWKESKKREIQLFKQPYERIL